LVFQQTASGLQIYNQLEFGGLTPGVMETVDDQSLYSSMLATTALRASAHWLESFR
jgi:hypothetical protein